MFSTEPCEEIGLASTWLVNNGEEFNSFVTGTMNEFSEHTMDSGVDTLKATFSKHTWGIKKVYVDSNKFMTIKNQLINDSCEFDSQHEVSIRQGHQGVWSIKPYEFQINKPWF